MIKIYQIITIIISTLLFNTSYTKNLRRNYSSRTKEISFVPVKNSLGYLSYNFLFNIANVFKPDVFIETGTFLGNSTAQAAKIFSSVHTIELDEKLYKRAKANLKQKNITVHYGDSVKVLKNLIPTLNGKLIFWLDGHYSGVHDGHQTALSDNNTLIKELEIIKKSQRMNSIIIIDDIRLCDESVIHLDDPIIGGYPTIDEICKKLLEINNDYRFLVIGDVLMAYPNEPEIIASITLQACTMSRFFNGENLDINFVLDLEKVISYANNEEKKSIEILNNTFGSDWHAITYGVAKHYILWHALILLQNKDYEKSYDRLNHINKLGFNHWRISWYMAQAAYGLGEIDKADNLIKEIYKFLPKNISDKLIVDKAQPFINKILKN